MTNPPLPTPTPPTPAPQTPPTPVAPPTSVPSSTAPLTPPPSTLTGTAPLTPTMPKPTAPAVPPAVSAAGPAAGAPPSSGMPPTTPGASPITRPPTGAPGQPPSQLPRPPIAPPPGGAKPLPPAGAPKPAVAPAAGNQMMAKLKSSPFKFVPFLLIGLVVVGIVGFIISRVLGGSQPTSVGTGTTDGTATTGTKGTGTTRNTVPGQQTTITYWGLWEPSDVLTQVISDFEQQNPGVKVAYTKQSHLDYRERLQTAVASGTGPDLFRFHASWTPMLKNELSPVPNNVMSVSDFQSLFYPVAYQQLQSGGQLVGIPLMYDGLGLYYNKDILRSANAQPPTSWAELKILASQLTIKSGDTIQRGGLAIGNASNVEHFADIIGLLMLQNGADLTNPTGAEARDALLFYTDFMKTNKVWSDTLPSSTVAFARGDAAMMFAPSWRAHEIKAQNPNLNFGIAPLPKLGDNKVAWASYWAEGVSAQSKNKDAAWKFLKYLSTQEVQQKLYSEQAQVRSFGEPYSRVSMATQLAGDEYVQPFLSDAPSAKGWFLSSYTHDNGINDQMIKYYRDAINAIAAGKEMQAVLTTLNQGTAQVLRQYGVAATTPGSGGVLENR